ncbi:MAG TPA: peptide-methionine (S)-S-oxide reductase MsrA [Tenuifilaceae bacterium]|nr:peptide-methionine (S)-S-oxide reductase MsrA [Tenuifilaceae bacterium]HPN22966.1 peptide-methionine (S)-S-oxide reductase MsrA [Tenuifilaceae bacterium]
MLRLVTISFMLFISSISTAQTNKNNKNMSEKQIEVATLGAGCFWCVEAIFSRLDGVIKVESGYSGGIVKNPTYKAVCEGNTGHAEVIQVTFNPSKIPFSKILEVYFKTHDPTTLNRQGADIGTQYRSVIFYHSDTQKTTAEEIKKKLNDAGIWNSPIVTEIEPYVVFFKAEDYHQDYYANNKNQPYCRMTITPKIEKFEKIFKDYMKK